MSRPSSLGKDREDHHGRHRHRRAFHLARLRKLIAPREGPIQTMLDNMSTRLIKDMDEAGIDIAVLSENNPAAHNLDPETSVTMAKASNDFLYETIQANPKRFKGFAALPLPDPKAAADELERCVTKLGCSAP